MNVRFYTFGLVLITALLVGCATPVPMGLISTHVKTTAGYNDGRIDVKSAPRSGKASCWSILGLFAGGDNTIQAAASDGGITKIWYVDSSVNNILGFYGTYTTTVYGE